MTSRGPNRHRLTATGDGGWGCICGHDSTNTTTSSEEHLTKRAKAAFARLDDLAASARYTVFSARSEQPAANLIRNPGGWLHSGRLRPYMQPYYAGDGGLAVALDWAAVLADLDAGKLTEFESYDGEQTTGVLRVAASLVGHGQVCLARLPRMLTYAEQQRVREQLGELLPAD